MQDDTDKEHTHRPHPDFARGQEKEEHGGHDEPRPDYARGARQIGDVTSDSEQGDFAQGRASQHTKDDPQGDFARGIDREGDREGQNHPQ